MRENGGRTGRAAAARGRHAAGDRRAGRVRLGRSARCGGSGRHAGRHRRRAPRTCARPVGAFRRDRRRAAQGTDGPARVRCRRSRRRAGRRGARACRRGDARGVAPAAATARRSVSMRHAVLRTQPRPAAASRCAAGYYPLPIPIRRANAALQCECLFRLLKKKGS